MITSQSMTQTIDELLELSASLSGHLRKREVQFLATLPFLNTPGELLEIGSFKGKSTIILAKAALASGTPKIHACDPLSLTCSTDPTDATGDELPRIFKTNLEAHGVLEQVNFFQMKSAQLARTWEKPLKVLWIDGDHTYTGVMTDFNGFKAHLSPGGLVCFHDVLHGFDGPIRVFMEQVLLSDRFAHCGLCGSIGWGQEAGGAGITEQQWKNKLRLYQKLGRLLPMVIRKNQGLDINEHIRKFFRSLVPHGPINPVQWVADRNRFIEAISK